MRARYFGLSGALAVVLSGCGGGDSSCCETPQLKPGQFGSLLNAAEFGGAPKILPPEALTNPPTDPTGLPTSVTLTNLPPVVGQGTPGSLGYPGSCEAQSFGYGLGTYTAARNPDGSMRWNAGYHQNDISPAYLFAWAMDNEDRPGCQGSLALPYLSRLVGQGAPNIQDVPYKANCSYLSSIPINATFAQESPFRLGSYATMQVNNDPVRTVATIKKLLAAGNAVAFSGSVLEDYDNAPQFTNGVIYSTDTYPDSGHGQMIVGYDDTVGDPANPGAFLVQNSFTKSWPPTGSGSTAPAGMAYWSYNTFTQTQNLLATAYSRDPNPTGGTPLTGSQPGAPAVTVTRAYQWAPSTGGVWLILTPNFAQPVNIQSITLTEPTTGTQIQGAYNTNYANGYVYFKREDGNQFLAGDYSVAINVYHNGTPYFYTGSVTVGASAPSSPEAQAVSAFTAITDSRNVDATITLPSSRRKP
ncbi:hypothetical protein EON81_15285 [bacterium]|nr:MAG: hypothetical protein EON81_15285 [bacterium]